VVPEVEAIDIAVVEPHPCMVRMIDPLSWPGFKRITTGYRDSFIRNQWIQHWLLQGCRPDVGGKGFTVDCDVDALVRLIGNNPDSSARSVSRIGDATAKRKPHKKKA